MKTFAAALDEAIAAVCPIDGVSIGRKDEKSTWRIDFTKDATDDQRKAAQAVLESFVSSTSEDIAVDEVVTMSQLQAALESLNGSITTDQVGVAIAAAKSV